MFRGAADADVLRQVKPLDVRRLPARYDAPHAAAFYMLDELGGLVIELERVGSLSVTVDVSEDEGEEMAGLQGEDLWEWLSRTNRQDIIEDLTYRQLAAAVIADASHFLCESLLASGKGKMTVAYSLLRKPLKESLLLLEWLVADPGDFLSRFNGESVDGYVLNRLGKADRKRIMQRASELVDLPGVGDDFQWVVRYAKEYPNSLETMWTKATHLVTTVQASGTEPGNLNFVFSSESAVEEQWEHYYSIVPLVLYYFVAVAEQVVDRFVEWDEEARSTKVFLRQMAFFRWLESTSGSDELRESAAGSFKELSELSFPCLSCGAPVSVPPTEIDRFWLRAEMRCPRCARSYDLWEVLSEGKTEGRSAEE